MKYSIAILSALGAVVAQDLSSLPACGQTCVNNMVAIATSTFGCAVGDIACYCRNMDFGYGVRDCSNEACSSSEEAQQVISYGVNYCSQVASTGASDLPGLTAITESATGSGSSPTDVPASTPVTTSALEATGTDGSVQTTGFTTIFGPVGGATTTGDDGASTTESGAEPTGTESGSSETPSEGSPTTTGGAESSGAESSGAESSGASESGAENSSGGNAAPTTGAAPLATRAPMIAGGALAAALLLI